MDDLPREEKRKIVLERLKGLDRQPAYQPRPITKWRKQAIRNMADLDVHKSLAKDAAEEVDEYLG